MVGKSSNRPDCGAAPGSSERVKNSHSAIFVAVLHCFAKRRSCIWGERAKPSANVVTPSEARSAREASRFILVSPMAKIVRGS